MENRDDWFIDYYVLLGIPEDASPAEIKRTYRELTKTYHPDLYSADSHLYQKAEALTCLIHQAYSTLSDPQQRQRYDHMLHAQRQASFSASQPTLWGLPDPDPPSFSSKSWIEILLDWFDRRRAALPHRPLLGTLRKFCLFPLPFFLATGMGSLFWNLGQIVGAPFLGGVTAVLAYLLLLVVALGHLLLPIRHRPLLSLTEKVLLLPPLGMLLIGAGWLWIEVMDQGGRGNSQWDLCWWCGLISCGCAAIAYL